MTSPSLRVLLSLASLSLLTGCWSKPEPPVPPVKLEIRRAEKEPAEGLIEATALGMSDKIYMHPTAALTEADITRASVVYDENRSPAMGIVFTPEGAKKMEEVTEAQFDKPLAILIDGKLISAPTVRAKVSGEAQITGSFTKEEITRWVRAINQK